jgi:hypothetical protein
MYFEVIILEYVDCILSIYIYIRVIHNNSQTHKVKCYKLVVCGNMFRLHCGHLQAIFLQIKRLQCVYNVGSHSLYNHTLCGLKTLLKVFTDG